MNVGIMRSIWYREHFDILDFKSAQFNEREREREREGERERELVRLYLPNV